MQHELINLHLTNDIWKINELSGLTPEAEEAREKIHKIYERLTKILDKQKQRKEEKNSHRKLDVESTRLRVEGGGLEHQNKFQLKSQ